MTKRFRASFPLVRIPLSSENNLRHGNKGRKRQKVHVAQRRPTQRMQNIQVPENNVFAVTLVTGGGCVPIIYTLSPFILVNDYAQRPLPRVHRTAREIMLMSSVIDDMWRCTERGSSRTQNVRLFWLIRSRRARFDRLRSTEGRAINLRWGTRSENWDKMRDWSLPVYWRIEVDRYLDNVNQWEFE